MTIRTTPRPRAHAHTRALGLSLCLALCGTGLAWAQSAGPRPGNSAPGNPLLKSAAGPMEPCVLLRERGPQPESAIVARPLPHDARLVVFPYDKNALYPVNTTFNRYTHLEFEEGELVKASYINDETEWEQRVAGTRRDIFVRPRVRSAQGSMTVITDRRRYQIDLLDVSGCPSESRYQRVSWHISEGAYEDVELLERTGAAARPTRGASAAAGATAQTAVQAADSPFPPTTAAPASSKGGQVGPDTGEQDLIQLSRLNLAYDIEGDAELRPERVFDDGVRTWVQFPKEMSLRPALFGVSPDGLGDPVEYAPRGHYFVIARVFAHGLLLKLGKQEVRIRNKASSSSCGWLDSRCNKVQAANVLGER